MPAKKKTTRKPSAPRLAVFCSGNGSNFQAILHAIDAGRLRARVVVMVSDKDGIRAQARAARAAVEALYLDPKAFRDKAAYERALIAELEARKVEWICLAGFMRILGPTFISRYEGRILNVHPALLPAFKGAHAVQDALDWGVKVTGVTVHFVDGLVDNGPIILQEAVPVRDGDTCERLLTRVHKVEHRLYPEAIRRVLSGKVKPKKRPGG